MLSKKKSFKSIIKAVPAPKRCVKAVGSVLRSSLNKTVKRRNTPALTGKPAKTPSKQRSFEKPSDLLVDVFDPTSDDLSHEHPEMLPLEPLFLASPVEDSESYVASPSLTDECDPSNYAPFSSDVATPDPGDAMEVDEFEVDAEPVNLAQLACFACGVMHGTSWDTGRCPGVQSPTPIPAVTPRNTSNDSARMTCASNGIEEYEDATSANILHDIRWLPGNLQYDEGAGIGK